MTLTIEIIFECAGEREAFSLEAVLGPDNHPLPKGQTLVCERRGNRLTFRISSPDPKNCVTSARSLVSDAALFSRVWSVAS